MPDVTVRIFSLRNLRGEMSSGGLGFPRGYGREGLNQCFCILTKKDSYTVICDMRLHLTNTYHRMDTPSQRGGGGRD